MAYVQVPVRTSGDDMRVAYMDINQLQNNIDYLLDMLNENGLNMKLEQCNGCGSHYAGDVKCIYCGTQRG